MMQLTPLQAVLALLLAIAGSVLWRARPFFLRSFTSSLLNIPGPRSPSWIMGNMKAIRESEEDSARHQWIETYGPVSIYRRFLNRPTLLITDMRALSYVLTHSADYHKPAQTQHNLSRLLGDGVLVTEGERHRQQRRIMNPAFGPAQIRELTQTFLEKSMELRDVWAGKLSTAGDHARVDAISDLSKATLDVIGLAGFNYNFDSLNPHAEPSELAKAFEKLFALPERPSVPNALRAFVPFLKRIKDERTKRSEEAKQVMRRIGVQLVAEKKAAILREASEKTGKDTTAAGVGRSSVQGRDLLTLLIKANMANDVPDSQRLSDEEVLAQVPTFLVAGHETTSAGTTWCLFALSEAQDVQRKLREELLAVEADTPSMDELMALPYLDMVIRETLRLHAPVHSTSRIATKDDVIPLNAPFVDRNGRTCDHVRISAGDVVAIPILALNRLKSLWGEDANEFRPERWEHPPEAISNIPGVWGHLLTFLGGPRACIGYRFSLVEMKALIFTLVRAFEFEPAVPSEDVKKSKGIVSRPMLRSDPKGGIQMPLVVRVYKRA